MGSREDALRLGLIAHIAARGEELERGVDHRNDVGVAVVLQSQRRLLQARLHLGAIGPLLDREIDRARELHVRVGAPARHQQRRAEVAKPIRGDGQHARPNGLLGCRARERLGFLELALGQREARPCKLGAQPQ